VNGERLARRLWAGLPVRAVICFLPRHPSPTVYAIALMARPINERESKSSHPASATLPKLGSGKKTHRNLQHWQHFQSLPTTLFLRSGPPPVHITKYGFSFPLLSQDCVMHPNSRQPWRSLVGLSSGSPVLGQPVAGYIALISLLQLSLTDAISLYREFTIGC
jgi:hypothetical protein